MLGRFVLAFVLGAALMLASTVAANEYVLEIPLLDFVRADYLTMCRQTHERAMQVYRDLNPEQTASAR